jgi:hypothetical protein
VDEAVKEGSRVRQVIERTYAHLKPDAYEADYGRVAFRMPTTGNVVELSTAR